LGIVDAFFAWYHLWAPGNSSEAIVSVLQEMDRHWYAIGDVMN
jgi:hypothetical protein